MGSSKVTVWARIILLKKFENFVMNLMSTLMSIRFTSFLRNTESSYIKFWVKLSPKDSLT